MTSKEIQGTIAPYVHSASAPWNKDRVKHLYNRLGSGCSITELNQGLDLQPDELVDQLIDEALLVPTPDHEVFPWALHPVILPDDPYEHFDFVNRMHHVKEHLAANLVLNPVKYKLVLFWSNHFVTENYPNAVHSTIPTYLYYHELCKHSIGNFEKFVEKMSLTPMMLMYLNGNSNTVEKPNENFARELLELFTVGEGNYSQTDIENVARGYTGWKAGSHLGYYNIGQYVFSPDEYILVKEHHDWTTIELFDESFTPQQPGTDEEAVEIAYQQFQWIVTTILSKRTDEVANFICGKLYKFYVYEEPNADIVAAMADVFKQNWEIADVLRLLFKSEHFFDQNAIGAQIKSSVEMYAQYVRKVGYVHNVHWYSSEYALHPDFDPEHPLDVGDLGQTCHNHATWWAFQSMNQHLLWPPNVAGWKGGRFWLTETNLLGRWSTFPPQVAQLLGFAGWSDEAKMDRPLNQSYIVEHLKELTNDSSDVEVVVRAIITYHFSCLISEEAILAGIEVFKGNAYPSNYYTDGIWQLDIGLVWNQYGRLISYLAKLPEYQLT